MTPAKPRTLQHALLESLRFRGTASLGERGQIAVPAELRRELGMMAGEKLMVFSIEGQAGAVILTAEGVAALLHGAGPEELKRLFAAGLAPVKAPRAEDAK